MNHKSILLKEFVNDHSSMFSCNINAEELTRHKPPKMESSSSSSKRDDRRKRQKVLVQQLLNDYANSTTLHGLPYITRRGLTIVEKIFWLLTFVASVCLCSYYIYSVWLKWKNSPVIVTVSEHLVPVSMVPFPSITICPQTKSMSSIYDYGKEKSKVGHMIFKSPEYIASNRSLQETITMYEDISAVCGVYIVGVERIHPRNFSDNSFIDNMFKVSPDFDDVFILRCFFRGAIKSCKDMFKRVLTSEGVCYNINSLPFTEIFRENSIPRVENDSGGKPIHGQENAKRPDLEIHLMEDDKEKGDVCNYLNSGFRVYIQHPADQPQTSLYYYSIVNGHVSSMALSFSMLNTSESLKSYDPKIRQCYLPDERYLKHFKIYTANNCKIECLANYTLHKCGCVGFYMPRDNDTAICTLQRQPCMDNVHKEIIYLESVPETAICNCLLPCNNIEYDADVLKTEFNIHKLFNHFGALRKETENDTARYSRLEVYFKKPHFISMRRSEMFGMIDFLANCGGLLGLFLGFSFLSLVELVYFVTLRLLCALKKDLQEEHTVAVIGSKDNIKY